MATYNPDPALLRRQLRSIQGQSVTDWLCCISDDCSTSELYDVLVTEVGGDDRFVVSRSPERLGVYRNFERALGMVPAGTAYVALSDQDDEWFPNKLAALRDALATGAQLAYSDFRIVDPDGAVLLGSLWESRRNSWERLDVLGVFNTVTGAAAMFPASLLAHALPFPELPGAGWHDHWLTLLALARGRVVYVEEVLFDHIHHGRNVTGDLENARPHRRWGSQLNRQGVRALVDGWRHHYLFGVRYLEELAGHLQRASASAAPRDKQRELDRLVHLSSSPRSWLWVTMLAARPHRSDDFVPGRARHLLRGIGYAQAARVHQAATAQRERMRGSAPGGARP